MYVIIFMLGLLLMSCESCEEKEKLEETSLDELLERAEIINNDIKQAEQKWEIRRQKGDTLPVDYKILIGIMPNIEGYRKQEPEGLNVASNGATYSSAIQQYESKKGDLNIAIFDYNGEINMFAAASSWKTSKTKVEDEDGFHFAEPYKDFIDTWIYTEYNKINKNAVVILAINDRFIISVNANEQDNVDFARKIAEQILTSNRNLFSK